MFTLDRNDRYQMPAHFGPRSEQAGFRYNDLTMMVVPFLTDRERLAAYLPAPFTVAEHAVVTVTYCCNRNVDFLAGRGYNMVSVNAAVLFDGEGEKLEGTFTLVIWENLTDQILIGREVQGIPKIYADINDHRVIDGEWRATASHFGNKIVDLSIGDLRDPTTEEAQIYGQATEGKDNPMGWRFMPGVGGLGEGLSEFTTFPSETTLTEVQIGQGSIDWQYLTWEQNPTQYHIVNALADLPVLAVLPAMVAKGSADLRLPNRKTRTIG